LEKYICLIFLPHFPTTTYSFNEKIILLLIPLIFHRIITEIMILNHRNNHFLQTDTPMHKVHTASIDFPKRLGLLTQTYGCMVFSTRFVYFINLVLSP